MPTNPLLGFMLIPLGMLFDPDFHSLTPNQRSLWFTVLMLGNHSPTGTFATTLRALATYSRVSLGAIQRGIASLVQRGWIAIQDNNPRHTVITLIKKDRWQSF